MEWIRESFTITDDRRRVDVHRTHALLAGTYWAVRRPRNVVAAMIEHSLCFTLLHDAVQIGFGRAVTDFTTFSWLADVVVDPAFRGRGLGAWLVSCIRQHPAIAHTHMVLQTRDAHGLYEKYGFAQSAALMTTAVDGL